MDLSPTHVHLLLNHFPTIGFIIGIILFVAGLVAKSDHIKQAALVVFAGIALLTIPTYCTGNAAERALRTNPDAPHALILMHESAAFFSLLWMIVTGGFAWLGLWQYRRMLHLPRWNVGVILILSVVTLVTVSRAANLGGEIRHPEIRITQAADSAELPLGRQIGNFIRDTPFVWPSLETLHFIGLSLLIGVLLLADLRMLGIAPSLSLGAIDRLMPWAILGFGINTLTGMLFFLGATDQYTNNPAFYWKLVFLVAAGANTLYFFFDRGWGAEPGMRVPIMSRVVVVGALFFWVGVMFWGSMLPFIGNAF
jgi:uncharacterized membrane protein